MKPLVVCPIHGQHAYAIDRSELGPTYELTFVRRGRGFRVRMKSESGEIVHEPWARVRRAMRVFGWVSHNAPREAGAVAPSLHADVGREVE